MGGVGKAFLRQLSNYIASNRSAPHTLIPILVSRSSKALVSQDYSPIQLPSALESLETWTSKPLSFPDEVITFLKGAPGGEAILVDNTSNEKLAECYPDFLKEGIHIATPNKKAFSGDISLWNSIFSSTRSSTNPKGGYVFHESTVGAGLPVLSTLKELVETGDKVKKIEGIFSGTMSFLFNTFAPVGSSSDARFSEVVIKAKGLGYTVSGNVKEQRSPYTYTLMVGAGSPRRPQWSRCCSETYDSRPVIRARCSYSNVLPCRIPDSETTRVSCIRRRILRRTWELR